MKDHEFGGVWTQQKLEHVSDYLDTYLKVMKRQKWCELIYLDCFAGTGYRNKEDDSSYPGKTDDPQTLLDFEEDGEDEDAISPEASTDISEEYRAGSARLALEKGGFREYVFVEKAKKRCESLHQLAAEFPARNAKIVPGDANAFLQNELGQWDWSRTRACVFVDPYGVQLEWKSLVALAETKGADVWILMPVGVGVNRMLTRSGKISRGWENRLTKFFGCPPEEWRPKIYRDIGQMSFLEEETETKKVPRLEEIAQYMVERLETIFEGVAKNPRPLGPPKKAPLFYLFFAAANPKGAPIAIDIAEHILEGKPKKASRPKSRRPKDDQSSSYSPLPIV